MEPSKLSNLQMEMRWMLEDTNEVRSSYTSWWVTETVK
jgi:hypothetical protein